MDTFVLVIIGALVGVRARRHLASPPYSKFDHALIGGLVTLLGLTLLEMTGILVAEVPIGFAGIAALVLDVTVIPAWRSEDNSDRAKEGPLLTPQSYLMMLNHSNQSGGIRQC